MSLRRSIRSWAICRLLVVREMSWRRVLGEASRRTDARLIDRRQVRLQIRGHFAHLNHWSCLDWSLEWWLEWRASTRQRHSICPWSLHWRQYRLIWHRWWNRFHLERHEKRQSSHLFCIARLFESNHIHVNQAWRANSKSTWLRWEGRQEGAMILSRVDRQQLRQQPFADCQEASKNWRARFEQKTCRVAK